MAFLSSLVAPCVFLRTSSPDVSIQGMCCRLVGLHCAREIMESCGRPTWLQAHIWIRVKILGNHLFCWYLWIMFSIVSWFISQYHTSLGWSCPYVYLWNIAFLYIYIYIHEYSIICHSTFQSISNSYIIIYHFNPMIGFLSISIPQMFNARPGRLPKGQSET